jgi:RNA polymerase sigma factor for flagellar operon FliA
MALVQPASEEDWRAFKHDGNDAARGRLAEHYLPLVKYVIDRIAYKLPDFIDREDLISEGIVGLIDALDKFELERDLKFETYAVVRIRGAVLDSLRQLDWVPRSLRQRSRDIERAYCEVERSLGRSASDAEVATHLGISVKELNDTLSDVAGAVVFSFEELLQMNDEDKPLMFINRIKDTNADDPSSALIKNEVRRLLVQAVDNLPGNERTIIGLYYSKNFTLKEIGASLGVTESRVSQLHAKALVRLKGALTRAGGEVFAE